MPKQNINTDVYVKGDLEAKTGLVVGSAYADTETPPTNGAIIQGDVGFGTDNPIASVQIAKGFALKHVNQTSNYTLTTDNCWVSFSGTRTATLPDATTVTSVIFIIKNANASDNVTVDTNGGNIDGSASKVLGPRECLWVASGGSNYQILNHFDGTV